MAIIDKTLALKGMHIESYTDYLSDNIVLEKRIPAQVMQIKLSMHEFENIPLGYINEMFERNRRYEDNFVHDGPTTKELRDPRIRYAYEELQILRKLIGAK